MKVLSLVVLILVSGMSEARSLMKPDVRLEVQVKQIQGRLPLAGPVKLVRVFSDGRVVGSQCDESFSLSGTFSRFENCKNVELLEKLSRAEMRNLETLIEEARLGTIVHPSFGTPICLAIPTRSVSYSADNGNIFLYGGSEPCGHKTRNDAPAAQTLVETLRKYSHEYSQRVGSTLEE